ncbi:MAG TPA: Tol-Pal system beta propeller repeat protein TolB [Gammaproteobacteria bacterium]|nr:Tol-Pal system beta propeller repeat protein TolB [Gammaproteobacteria bacterium]
MSLLRSLPLALALLLGVTQAALAALTVEVTQGVAGAQPIAVVPFGWEGGQAGMDLAKIVAADLKRSGRFAPMAEKDMLSRPVDGSQVNFRDWRLLNVESLLIGKVIPRGAGYTVQFQLFDVFRGVQLTGYSIRSRAKGLRRTAHQIADIVYETLTGEPGAFDTRIAYVTMVENGNGERRYSLQVADADGFNPRPVVNSKEPLLSPAWSPDGSKLAYVSFENKRPQIYIQDLSSGQRSLASDTRGLNGAPAWSPDGKQLALVLSKDGNPEIYTLELATKRLQRVTHHFSIDTEPVWTADGKHIIFTSDRGGAPQLYRTAVRGGRVERLTFEGRYNARASIAQNGKRIAFVNGDQGRYRIAVMDLASRTMQIVSDGDLDESPSFAPNGSMVIYASEANKQGVLRAVSVDGNVRQRLYSRQGDTREPAWSPFRQ